MNWLCVHTVATVVISLIVTLACGCAPTDAIRAMAGLSPLVALAVGRPLLATRYNVESPPGGREAVREKRPSAPVRAWASCFGALALADHKVTVEPAIGAPAPRTRPLMVSAASAGAFNDIPKTAMAPIHRIALDFITISSLACAAAVSVPTLGAVAISAIVPSSTDALPITTVAPQYARIISKFSSSRLTEPSF